MRRSNIKYAKTKTRSNYKRHYSKCVKAQFLCFISPYLAVLPAYLINKSIFQLFNDGAVKDVIYVFTVLLILLCDYVFISIPLQVSLSKFYENLISDFPKPVISVFDIFGSKIYSVAVSIRLQCMLLTLLKVGLPILVFFGVGIYYSNIISAYFRLNLGLSGEIVAYLPLAITLFALFIFEILDSITSSGYYFINNFINNESDNEKLLKSSTQFIKGRRMEVFLNILMKKFLHSPLWVCALITFLIEYITSGYEPLYYVLANVGVLIILCIGFATQMYISIFRTPYENLAKCLIFKSQISESIINNAEWKDKTMSVTKLHKAIG